MFTFLSIEQFFQSKHQAISFRPNHFCSYHRQVFSFCHSFGLLCVFSCNVTISLCRLADVIKSGEGLNEKHSAPENIHSLINELKMYQIKVPELWENRNKQLLQCKDALVCRHSYEKLDTEIHKIDQNHFYIKSFKVLIDLEDFKRIYFKPLVTSIL